MGALRSNSEEEKQEKNKVLFALSCAVFNLEIKIKLMNILNSADSLIKLYSRISLHHRHDFKSSICHQIKS